MCLVCRVGLRIKQFTFWKYYLECPFFFLVMSIDVFVFYHHHYQTVKYVDMLATSDNVSLLLLILIRRLCVSFVILILDAS